MTAKAAKNIEFLPLHASACPPLTPALKEAIRLKRELEGDLSRLGAKKAEVAQEVTDLTNQLRLLEADLNVCTSRWVAAEARGTTDPDAGKESAGLEAQMAILQRDVEQLTREQASRSAVLAEKTKALQQHIRSTLRTAETNWRHQAAQASDHTEVSRLVLEAIVERFALIDRGDWRDLRFWHEMFMPDGSRPLQAAMVKRRAEIARYLEEVDVD